MANRCASLVAQSVKNLPAMQEIACNAGDLVRRGAQGASRVVPGKSGLYVCDEGEPINAPMAARSAVERMVCHPVGC